MPSTPTPAAVSDDPSETPHDGARDEPVTQDDVVPLAIRGTAREGRYVLGPKLGEGGMSVVHEAHDLLLGRTVALKELHVSWHTEPELIAREARALAAVDHPSVVRVHSVYPYGNPPFIAMERARGRPLSSILLEGRMTVARALGIARQVGAGLDALHAAGVVHGDVKPANVIVDEHDGAKLIDVGLSSFFDRMIAGEMIGTPTYMAPERALGSVTAAGLVPRSDVYSFAVLCFEMLTGRLPFSATTTTDVLHAHAMQRPAMPSHCVGMSTEFDWPLASALAKRPEQRPATCLTLVAALERASTGCDSHGRRLRVLVADDDDGQRMLLMQVIGVYLPGASVILCSTGQTVLEAVAAQAPSAVLLDLAMPAPSGIDLVQRIRRVAPTSAVVIVTGGGSGVERTAARDLGVRRFLVKPFEVDELVDALREAVGQETRRAL